MSSIVTNGGDTLTAKRLIGDKTEVVDTIAVGSGTATPTQTDTALENEVYRSTTADSNVSLQLTGSKAGEFIGRITVSGGTEVPAGTALTEIGLFGDQNTLVYRETFTAVTIDAGDRKTFEFTIEVDN